MATPTDKTPLAANFAAQNRGGKKNESPSPVFSRQEQHGAFSGEMSAHMELARKQQMMQVCSL